MKGENFEKLVAWINKSLHSKASITPDETLKDLDTGNPRQIDACIRFKEGPTEIMGIIEARDRSRKVGVAYIEEVISKKASVGADFAIIVSNNGFGGPAIAKAKRHGIRLFTLEEALIFDWSDTIKFLTVMEQNFLTENMIIRFHQKSDDSIIVPHEIVLKQLEENPKALVLETNDGTPLAPLQSLSRGFQQMVEKWLKSGKENGQHVRLYFELKTNPDLFIRNSADEQTLVDYISFDSFCWLEETVIDPVINQYKNNLTGDIEAEIVSMQSSRTGEQIDISIERPNEIQRSRKMTLRTDRKLEQTEAQAALQFWFTVKKVQIKKDGKFYQITLPSKPEKQRPDN